MNNKTYRSTLSNLEDSPSKLKCTVCFSNKIETLVFVILNSKVIHQNTSGIKAMNWAFENHKYPCIIEYVNVCSNCKRRVTIFKRVFNDIKGYENT